jgi:MYXO-CTERM domain-containing protein
MAVTEGPAAADWPPPDGADLSDPANWPNDPGYAGQWNLWSFMPEENAGRVTDYERSIGSGFHADRAWQMTTGDSRVVIAVLDSGARWRERDLVNKYFINRGELPVPEAACGTAPGADLHDANGDGIFNVQDYTTATGVQQPTADRICDSRLSDANDNGILDPQDLITAFSDDVDDDGNGWTDDISGWDIFFDDNDPNDDTDFGHGTGEAKDSGGETNNGISDAGVCPDCMLLMVRVGDSFVVDVNDFALAAVFAVDSGAAVIQEALGSINGTPMMHEAVDYAWKQNAAVVASAADEDSFHANLPGSINHTIYVHANTYNKTSREASDTFLAFNNCTNYGAQLLLSTPGSACSSEAVGKTSGIVGLMYAAGLQAGLEPPGGRADTDLFGARVLSGEEIKQLLLTTVDDIYDPDDANDPEKYETYPGWEKRFGYGRTNAARAVEAILDLKIPPVVDVWEPAWFKVIDPVATPTVDITGNISYRTNLFDSYDYVVEWAPGIEPFPEDWNTLAEGTGETEAIEGTLASWDVSSLEIDNETMPEPDVDVNRFMVTVRVRVTLNSSDSSRDGVEGEIRRAFHIRHDPDLRPGFPVKLTGSGEPSPKISDLDGDGAMELIYADGGGTIHVFDGDAQSKPGWPQQLPVMSHLRESNPDNHRGTAGILSGDIDADSRSFVMQAPAVGDLDGDGPDGKSIVVASFEGEIFAWGADGTMRPGFPVALDRANAETTTEDWTLDSGVFSAPVLGDLDGDGDLEIIVAALDAHVYAWHHDGSAVAGWPVLLSSGEQRRRIIQTPALGDIDGDGEPELVVGTNEEYNGSGKVYALDPDGTVLPNWPRTLGTTSVLPFVGNGMPNSPAMADFDRDGVTDVVISGIVGLPTMIKGDGTSLGTVVNSPYGPNSNSDDIPSFVAIANGTVGDLNNDEIVDIVWGGAGIGFAEAFASSGSRVDIDHHVGAWSSKSLQYLPGFPTRTDDHQFFMNPSIADVDGDGKPEVLSGSGGYYLRAWNANGDQPEGWPKFTGGWIISSPAVGDLDGDGTLEVAVANRDGYLYVFNTEGKTDGRVDWASFHHDDHNTGNLGTPIGFGSAPGDGDGGCGCRTGSRGAAPFALLAAFVLLSLRRRRSRG